MMTRIAAGQRAGLHARAAAASPLVAPQGRAASPAPDRPAVAQHDLASLRPDPGSRGKPLPRDLRWKLEHGFGTKLGHVRLHTDAAADRLNRKHRAVAAAQGANDIYFARGEYDPDSPEGQDIIGHEVAHTLQQRAGRVPMATASQPVNADRRLEAEADGLGALAAQGQRVPFAGAHAIRPGTAPSGEVAIFPSYAAVRQVPIPALHLVSSKERLRNIKKATQKRASEIRNAVTKIAKSKGKMSFYERRAPTAYGFRTRAGRRHLLQGPHMQSHVSKDLIIAAMISLGIEPLKLLGTPFAPRPDRARKMMKDRLRPLGKVLFDQTLEIREKHLEHYEKHWKIATNAKLPVDKRRNSLRFIAEANPAATYNIQKGVSSSSNMAGKGENRKQAARDFLAVITNPRLLDLTNSSGLATLDTQNASQTGQIHSQRSFTSLLDGAVNDEFNSDSEDSSHDDNY